MQEVDRSHAIFAMLIPVKACIMSLEAHMIMNLLRVMIILLAIAVAFVR